MAPKTIDIIAKPSEVMAYLASLAGPEWAVLAVSEELNRVTLQTKMKAFSFGAQVQASILPIERGCRVILEGKRVHPLNLTAGVGGALRTIEANLRRRFPQPVGAPI